MVTYNNHMTRNTQKRIKASFTNLNIQPKSSLFTTKLYSTAPA